MQEMVVPSSGSMYQVALPWACPPVSSATMPNCGARAQLLDNGGFGFAVRL